MDEKQMQAMADEFVAECKAGKQRLNGDPEMREVALSLSDRDYKAKAQQIAAWNEQIDEIKAEIAETNEELKKQVKDLEAKIKAAWLEIRMQSQKVVVKVAEHRDYDNGLIYVVRLPEWQLMEVSRMESNEQVKMNLGKDKPEEADAAADEPASEPEPVQDAEFEDVGDGADLL